MEVWANCQDKWQTSNNLNIEAATLHNKSEELWRVGDTEHDESIIKSGNKYWHKSNNLYREAKKLEKEADADWQVAVRKVYGDSIEIEWVEFGGYDCSLSNGEYYYWEV